ncbi:hypothetical protein EOM60_00405 [Candidatus Saccharibacteria bacterium]|nr:hypothetical protein [Candidatus Saccharibacteria bacterium]
MVKPKVLIEKELGALPSVSEMEVVDILVINKIPKFSVKFLKPVRVKGQRTPDILIDSEPWEIKSIEKLGKYTLDHAERAGLKQANNLIFDFRKLREEQENKVIKKIKSDFERTKSWRGLVVIVRFNGQCLTFHK